MGNTDFFLGIWSQHRRGNLWCIWGWSLSRGAGAAAWTFRSSRNSSSTVSIPWDRASCEIQVKTHSITYNFICTKQYGASIPLQLNSSVAIPSFTCHVAIINVLPGDSEENQCSECFWMVFLIFIRSYLQVLFVKDFIMIVYFRVPHRMALYLYQVLPAWNVRTVGLRIKKWSVWILNKHL